MFALQNGNNTKEQKMVAARVCESFCHVRTCAEVELLKVNELSLLKLVENRETETQLN